MDEPFSHAEYCEMQDVFPNLISLRSDSSSSLIKSSPVDYIDISDDIRQTNGFLYITSALPVLYIAIILSVSGFTVIASKRGSNQGATQRTRTRQCRGDAQRTAGGGGQQADPSCPV